jgi:hypothetical protein
MDRFVPIVKEGVAFKFFQLKLPGLKNGFNDKKINLRTWTQGDDLVTCHIFFLGEILGTDLLTEFIGVVFYVFAVYFSGHIIFWNFILV